MKMNINKFKENELFKIENLSKDNKEILINLYELKKDYELKSITFILDNENNLYFIINDNDKILFYNYKFLNIELFNYLNKNSLNFKKDKFNLYYKLDIDLININSTNIKLNECNIIYINRYYKKVIKENLKNSLKNEI